MPGPSREWPSRLHAEQVELGACMPVQPCSNVVSSLQHSPSCSQVRPIMLATRSFAQPAKRGWGLTHARIANLRPAMCLDTVVETTACITQRAFLMRFMAVQASMPAAQLNARRLAGGLAHSVRSAHSTVVANNVCTLHDSQSGAQVHLVGTAHISQSSADLVTETIQRCVCMCAAPCLRPRV